MPSNKAWALGWVADKDHFAGLAWKHNLHQGPADSPTLLAGEAIKYVVAQTWWPSLMVCTVNDRTRCVFAVYVDYKCWPYPLAWIHPSLASLATELP